VDREVRDQGSGKEEAEIVETGEGLRGWKDDEDHERRC
jgi:hypothetical protein